MSIDVKEFVEQIEKDPHSCSLWNRCNDFTASEEDTVYLVRGILQSEAQARAEGERAGKIAMRREVIAVASAFSSDVSQSGQVRFVAGVLTSRLRALKVEGE